MLIILSPAKTMNMSICEDIPQGTLPMFDSDAEYIAHKMAHYSAAELEKLLKISLQLARINYERYQQFDNPLSVGKPAIFAYDGSVFKAISPSGFNLDDLEYAQDRVRIISTLYGLVRPLDTIKAYRIAFSLKIEGVSGSLYDYWYGKLTEPLIEATQKVGGILVNLASLDVQASLDMSKLNGELTVITPEFKDFKHGKYEVIRTYAKVARGAMTHFIIKERVQSTKDLTRFEWNGYKFNSRLSDDNNYIYTRG